MATPLTSVLLVMVVNKMKTVRLESNIIKVDTEMLDRMGSVDSGVYGVDEDGVYHMWYGSKSYFVEFTHKNICSECGMELKDGENIVCRGCVMFNE
jgi:hypothetical protein